MVHLRKVKDHRRRHTMKFSKAVKRDVALSAARAQMRRMGMAPETKTAEDALKVLDDLARVEPFLMAVSWYTEANENQIRLFKKEWEEWAAEDRHRNALIASTNKLIEHLDRLSV
jgi:hypothetical protein